MGEHPTRHLSGRARARLNGMRDSAVVVKPADGVDLSHLLGIYNASRAAVGCYAREVIDIERLSALVDGEEIHVAISDRKIVGFVAIWAPDRFIHHLYVDPKYQGRGIGSELLRMCENVYGTPLSLKCDTCNERAQRFYRKKGWLPSEKGVGADGPWVRLESRRAY